ncbi:MAG: hypothetical protein ACXVHX_24605 [Solirubrobacteraceae bacterium]
MSNGPTTVAQTHARTAGDAVLRALGLADAAAKRGEYAEALAWLETLEATGYELEPKYEYKRARWRLKVKGAPTGSSQWFG